MVALLGKRTGDDLRPLVSGLRYYPQGDADRKVVVRQRIGQPAEVFRLVILVVKVLLVVGKTCGAEAGPQSVFQGLQMIRHQLPEHGADEAVGLLFASDHAEVVADGR